MDHNVCGRKTVCRVVSNPGLHIPPAFCRRCTENRFFDNSVDLFDLDLLKTVFQFAFNVRIVIIVIVEDTAIIVTDDLYIRHEFEVCIRS